MSISDLYSSGVHKREISRFANLVKLALSNNIIANEEQELIDKLAIKLNITEVEYSQILKNPNDFPIIPPVDYKNRIDHLYNLVKMVFADNEATDGQIGILNKITIGLGFSKDHYQAVTTEAVHQIMNNGTIEAFTEAIKKVN